MLSIALIAGIWTTACIQTQIADVNVGYVKETYSISKEGDFEFWREWYSDSKCSEPKGTDTEAGTVRVGKRLPNIFIPDDMFEADFSTQKGVDLGAVSVKKDKLRVARGVANGSMRNTMLSLFEYTKRK